MFVSEDATSRNTFTSCRFYQIEDADGMCEIPLRLTQMGLLWIVHGGGVSYERNLLAY